MKRYSEGGGGYGGPGGQHQQPQAQQGGVNFKRFRGGPNDVELRLLIPSRVSILTFRFTRGIFCFTLYLVTRPTTSTSVVELLLRQALAQNLESHLGLHSYKCSSNTKVQSHCNISNCTSLFRNLLVQGTDKMEIPQSMTMESLINSMLRYSLRNLITISCALNLNSRYLRYLRNR